MKPRRRTAVVLRAIAAAAALCATAGPEPVASAAHPTATTGTASPVEQERSGSEAGPLTPEQALAAFEIEPGYRIELVASEPLIRDPVAMAFDERGRLYVAENRGYPDPLDGAAPPRREGVVARLEDTDLDGRFDKRTDFATGLTYPNGVMPWEGGIFVTCAPDLLYFRDTDGDGTADERRVVLTGFDTTKTAQIRFSHPTFGLDNRVYLTGGLNGGRVTSPEQPERPPVVFSNSDSRFDPRTLEFELAGGQGQFGQTFDDYGRRFICSNRHPVRHVVLEPRHLARNPHLAFSETMQNVSKVGSDAVVWPISADMTTASFMPDLMSAPHAGTFTAASGVHIHRGDALPGGHENSVFVCESAQNLVQRQVLTPDGVTFTSAPARTGREFLASRDSWFRPVFAANGPDGALYIVDMYRKVIDHPQYLPESSRALLDFQAGKERGRIYRIVSADWKADRSAVDLGRMSVQELARTLEHPNAWWRETAQRLLVERRNPDAVPHLRTMATSGRTAAARVHALWTLKGQGALEDADILAAFNDKDAAVRENAVRLAEARIGASGDMLQSVIELARDANPRVRFEAALTLGAANDASAIPALASIAARDGADRWTRAAVLSGIAGRTTEFLAAFTSSKPPDEARAAVMQDLGRLFGAGETPERCLDLIVQITSDPGDAAAQSAALSGIARGLHARGFGRDGRSALITLLESDLPRARDARLQAERVLGGASAASLDDALPLEQRLAAIELLGQTSYALAGKTLVRLLGPAHSSQVQVAAVRALAQLPEPNAAADLVAAPRWKSYTPAVRDAVLAALTTEDRHVHVLLDALDAGVIAVTALSPARRARLMNHRDPAIQARARAKLSTLTSGNRMQVYERLRPAVLGQRGDRDRGQAVFSRQCAACHMVAGTGGRLGPDLTGVRNQPAEALLLHTIVPDYEIAPGYESYVVTTRDRRTVVGRLESETPASVTMIDASAQIHEILRREVDSMTASPTSLMPNELESTMSPQDLSDLLAFLKAGAVR